MSRVYTSLIRISLSASGQTPVLLAEMVSSPQLIGQSVHTNLAITKLAFAFSVCLRIYIQYQYLQCFDIVKLFIFEGGSISNISSVTLVIFQS